MSHHPAKFGSHWHCGSGDTIFQWRYNLPVEIQSPMTTWWHGRVTLWTDTHQVTILPSLVAIGNLVVEIKCFYFVTWSRSDDAISTCMISLIWFNSSRCICLPYLVVIGLMKMEISILISIPTWTPRRDPNSPTGPIYWEIFKIRNTDLQLWSPGYGCQKN